MNLKKRPIKKIYEYDWWYDHLRYIVDAYIFGSFRKIRYEGLEQIPKDGSVIFSPNHCNALMDPFAVLAMDHSRKVFVARADIFRNPVLRKILTFLRIMPINRVRDGFRSVLRSEDTIEKSVEVLRNGIPFCILPEGTHRPMHSLLPLGKGISRIAAGAAAQLGASRPVYIVPVGCEYGDYFRFRSTLLVTVGKPIDITALIAADPACPEPELYLRIRERTADAMKQLIVYIPDDEDYDAIWELARLSSGTVPERKLRARLDANRKAAETLTRLRDESPEEARRLFEKAAAFGAARKRARISLHTVHTRSPLASALGRTLLTLLWLPLALVLGAASLPAWGIGEILASRVEDRSFRNSFRCGVIILVWTLMLLAGGITLFCTLKWYWALAALALLVPAPMLTYDYFEQVRRAASAWRYFCNGTLRRQTEQLKQELKKWNL